MIISGRKSSLDERDFPYVPRRPGVLNWPRPRQIEHSGSLPPCWNQGPAGTCESHAGAGKLIELYPDFMASRSAIHYAGRKLEHTLHQDTGIETRDLMKVLQAGVIAESEWPYDLTRLDEPPPPGSDVRMIGTYQRLRGQAALLDHLAYDGCVIFAFNVPDQYFTPGVPFPELTGGWTSRGWHCVLGVGYDLDLPRPSVLARGSYGEDFGDRGYSWIPLDWVTNSDTGDDMWSATIAPRGTVAGVEVRAA